ncbi:MAG: 30S ribosomal protein S17 [Thermovirgaceae bacterium]|nr:30S ribosomal protein S17 [Thermovirgaceae bacterium]
MEDRVISRKARVGIVVSDRMSKTVVIKVDRMAKHHLYGKPVLRSKKFMAHDEEETCRIGDRIRIEETRPLSRCKRWRVVEIIERAPVFGGSQEKEA